jgi:rubrerythrin
VGGRSRAAAQILVGEGFKEVYNLDGGMKAWQGHAAAGSAEMGMDMLTGHETETEIIVICYGMEEGLRVFYKTIEEIIEDIDVRKLIAGLSEIEKKHKEKLFRLYTSLDDSIEIPEQLEEKILPGVMEGGFKIDEFVDKNRSVMKNSEGVLSVAMMLEAQALDLYLRYSGKVDDENAKNVLFQIAQEEKAHLEALGQLMESKS